MNPKRKGISKKLRFEVFKRDSFTCQYCGNSAPDVILEVDHINPVSKGGNNEILNLITSCRSCNSGKSNIKLEENVILNRQIDQLKELNERREQLKLMSKWREELLNLENEQVLQLQKIWHRHTDFTWNEYGKNQIKILLKKYSFQLLHTAVEIACQKYIRFKDDTATDESCEYAFDRIKGICYYKSMPEEKQRVYENRGIILFQLKKKFNISNYQEIQIKKSLDSLISKGDDLEEKKRSIEYLEYKKDLLDEFDI